MFLKINKLVLFFIVICFISMMIPRVLNLADGNIFLQDFYAKRIMTIASLPFFLLIIFLSVKNKVTKINRNIILYIIFFIIILINSFIFRNSLKLILLDAFIAMLPIFFYLLVNKSGFKVDDYFKYFGLFLIIACIMAILGFKLQFSYFTLLGIVYVFFLTKISLKSIIFIIGTPALIMNTLIGKSSLIMIGILVLYFFVFEKTLVSKQKKIYLAIVPSVIIFIGAIVFWESIKATGAYMNTVYFFRHANFKTFNFTDMSTGQRIYEASCVLKQFSDSNLYINLFGNGFGATIDLSGTNDVAVAGSNSDLTKVRHIHIGIFAVLHRFGILGLLLYLTFIFKLIKSCKNVLINSNNYALTLSALYVVVIIFDSFISFPHMMSNFMFWIITFIIFLESDKKLIF
tara:strand:- start:1380 stop:2585 length:1206 start_codon:yes stop_codon:yes gene_type:complete